MKFLVLLFLFSTSTYLLPAQEVSVIKFSDLELLMNDREPDIQIINFWATWCKPCVKELPYFEKINETYKSDGVKVLLVSLDFVEDLESKTIPFIARRDIKSEVVLLDETDYNAFIDSIDPSWSGAIPATLVINNKTNQKAFFEKEFKEGELEKIVDGFLN